MIRVAMIAALSAAGEVLLPEGRFHGFSRLLCGLWVIYLTAEALLGASGVTQMPAKWELSPAEISAVAAQKEQAAKVLSEEERLLAEHIRERYGIAAGVRVDSDGRVAQIITAEQADDETRAAIAAEMGIEKGDIMCGR